MPFRGGERGFAIILFNTLKFPPTQASVRIRRNGLNCASSTADMSDDAQLVAYECYTRIRDTEE
jgi:hypothetical protein